MDPKTEPERLPPILLEEPAHVKFLWMWLRDQGTVSYSLREMEAATGVTYRTLSRGVRRLRELGLLEDLGERRERVRPTFRVVG
jgi:DNA-binding transcriptional ArsR family regulator